MVEGMFGEFATAFKFFAKQACYRVPCLEMLDSNSFVRIRTLLPSILILHLPIHWFRERLIKFRLRMLKAAIMLMPKHWSNCRKIARYYFSIVMKRVWLMKPVT